MELMIVLVIMSILVAIGYPLYTQQLMKSRRSDAQTALLNAANQEEVYYANNMAYATGFPSMALTSVSNEGWYQLSVATTASCKTNCIQITASIVTSGPQKNDTDCKKISITTQGLKTATNANGTDCWQ